MASKLKELNKKIEDLMEALPSSVIDASTCKDLNAYLKSMAENVSTGALSVEEATTMLQSVETHYQELEQATVELLNSTRNEASLSNHKVSDIEAYNKKWREAYLQELEIQNSINASLSEHERQLNARNRASKEAEGTRGVTGVSAGHIDRLEETAAKSREVRMETEKGVEVIKKGNVELTKTNKLLDAAWGVLKFIGNQLKDGAKQWMDINHETVEWGRSLGLTEKQSAGMRERMLDTYGALSLKFGLTHKEIFAFQSKYNDAVGTSIQLSTKHLETIVGLSKAAGEQATNETLVNMDKFGASAELASLHLAKVHNQAALSGLNAKKTSEDFAKNIKMASQYTFREGVNGVAKMTMLSEKFKFNLESMGGVIDKFSTIEGAIESSAKLQVLGGQFAQSFGNPLNALHDALIDAEGFTERVIGSFQDLAYFNESKGMMDMSQIDKIRLKQAAQELGISQEEAWNMATQKGKAKVISRDIQNNITDQKDKDFITNNAVYDENKGWVVNWTDENGNEQQSKVAEISKDHLEFIRHRASKEDLMSDDIRELRKYVVGYIKEQGYISMDEKLKGQDENRKTLLGKIASPVMSLGDNILGALTEHPILSAGLMIGGNAAITAVPKMMKNGFKGGAKNASKAVSKTSKVVKSLGKSLKGKGKWIALAAAAAYGGYELLNSNGNDKQENGGPQSDNIYGNNTPRDATQLGNIEFDSNPMVAQQQVTNVLLGQILETNKNGYANNLLVETDYQEKEYEAKATFADAVDAFDTVAGTIGGFFTGGASIAIGAANGAIGVNAALEGREKTTGEKWASVGLTTADYAIMGGVIGSAVPVIGNVVGATVGGAIGATVGVIQEFGDEIQEFGKSYIKPVGDFIGNQAKALIGLGDSRNEEEKDDEERETMKFGRVGADDPLLPVKRDMAILKMHDLLISIWYHMNGKQSNGKETEGSWLNPVTWFKKGYEWLTGEDTGEAKEKVDIQHFATGGVVEGEPSEGDTVPVMATGGEAVITPEQFAKLEATSTYAANQLNSTNEGRGMSKISKIKSFFGEVNDAAIDYMKGDSSSMNNLFLSAFDKITDAVLPDFLIGDKVDIKSPSVDSLSIDSISHNVSVTLNGSIKLESNGNNAIIDADKLLKDTQFMNQLINMVQKSIRLSNTNGMGDIKSGVGFSEFKGHQVIS